MPNQKQILSARGLRRLILQEVHRVIREQGNIVTTVATAAGEQEATDTQEELTKAIGEKLGLGANAPINAILQQFADQTPADTERIAGTLDQMVTNIPGVGDMSPSDLVQFIRTAKRLADLDEDELVGELGLAQESVSHRMLEQAEEPVESPFSISKDQATGLFMIMDDTVDPPTRVSGPYLNRQAAQDRIDRGDLESEYAVSQEILGTRAGTFTSHDYSKF
jgi:hypothetical protein